MKFAFVMYKNLGEWLSPDATATQSVSAADSNNNSRDGDAAAETGACLSEEESNDSGPSSAACRVVNSHVISLATSSSLLRSLLLTEPVTLILNHVQVCSMFRPS